MTYSEKLKDPRWQRKRLEVMERDEFACTHCQAEDKTLNVHHVNYDKGKSPWDYDDENFITLCEQCHKMLEARIRILREALAWDREAGLDLLAFSSARREEGPYNEYARVSATRYAEALRTVECAILHYAEREFAESYAESKMVLADGAGALVDLYRSIEIETERIAARFRREAVK